jgi:hypothetical protein
MIIERITVYLPDDVAARVEQAPNASAYVASAVRDAIRRESTEQVLAAAGITVTSEGVAAMRERYEAGKRTLAHRQRPA